MSTLTILPSGKTIAAEIGKTLLELIQAAGEEIQHKCGGNAQCGSCHIFLQAGRKSVSKIASAENQKLDSIVGVGSKSRLACQAQVVGEEDITVELLGFASGF
ncbi:2Fe-2S iron-sulfur cluster-binding protein [Methylococcus sp. EFPC2]|uniref:2Fe-2S iron-sulfur cluster-binding protein n=1 Tax=Methylococcus sp. EFPC2 TaxID=2812648 RepID=UPI00196815F5|nr:2Fe-2S iron-sulfur cluster-binding protein [Methylococcus sp. EFPC2]QSA99231.1 2Fe-2S iron-sulfur cluster binding domain-containing protein [Methylococcus sp. EFPC2]